jgi:pSer/pThr/pTyr-binding forkhead associated (FHA) protein
MIRLRIRDGGRARDVEFEVDRVRFGRLPECEVPLESVGVSREHAELVRERGGWRIRDLGSRNGTRVNGALVQDADVSEGDEVALADDVTIELIRLGGGDAGLAGGADPADEAAGPSPAPAAPRTDGFLPRQRWQLVPTAEGGLALPLRGSVTTFGREAGVGGVVDHASVSRIHARADAQPGGWLLTDLKSSNGTFVNDQRILRQAIVAGDRVRFGDVEFVLERGVGIAAGSWSGPLRVAVVVLLVVGVAAWAVSLILQREERARIDQAFRREAVASLVEAARAARSGSPDLARGHLAHAADLVLIAGLAPSGATLAKPRELFADVLPDLPAEQRDFDFASLATGTATGSEPVPVASLDPRAYVEHELRRYCAELGQDPNLPPEFVEQVWGFVQAYMRSPGEMRQMLRRARTLQPRIRAILAQQHLPVAVTYIAWVESRLDSMQVSQAGAVGLWQLMAATARERGLHIDEQDLRLDERTRVDKSTRAAGSYLAEMLRDQGPEYFMLVLASYNRGHNALKSLKQKIDDPMLGSTRKYWHLVEGGMLTQETRMYVPKVFAIRIVAENPSRFGF